MNNSNKKESISVRVRINSENKQYADKLSGRALGATVARESKAFSTCRMPAAIKKMAKR